MLGKGKAVTFRGDGGRGHNVSTRVSSTRYTFGVTFRGDEDLNNPNHERSASTATMPPNWPKGRGGCGACPGRFFGGG